MGKIDMIRRENGILRRKDHYFIARPNTCQSGFGLWRLIGQEDFLGVPPRIFRITSGFSMNAKKQMALWRMGAGK